MKKSSSKFSSSGSVPYLPSNAAGTIDGDGPRYAEIRRPVEEAGQPSEATLRTQRLMALLTPHETVMYRSMGLHTYSALCSAKGDLVQSHVADRAIFAPSMSRVPSCGTTIQSLLQALGVESGVHMDGSCVS